MLALIAEDSRTQAAQLRALLEEHGFEVAVAGDGEAALEAARARRPQILITDVMMPRRDGYSLCRAVKSDPELAAIPVVIVTSLSQPFDVLKALAAGADNFVTKPYDEEQLVRRVERTLAVAAGAPPRDVSLAGADSAIADHPRNGVEVLFSALEDAGLRAAQLDASRAALAEAGARREEILNVVSHELRNPLGILVMAADLFSEEATHGAPLAKQRAFAQRVARQAQRMLAIVEDLLDATRIEAGELRVEPIRADLVHVLRDTVDRMTPSLQRHTLELHAPDVLFARVDVDRIEQVVANYLTNAIKYSPDGGPIQVRLDVEADRAVVRVTDPGIGIPESALPNLFERYFRVPGSEKTAKGIGLGLYVVKRIVEAHGGSTRATSVVGKGSTFSFDVPLA